VEVASKRLELLHKLVPEAKSIALLVQRGNPLETEVQVRNAEAAVKLLGMRLRVLDVSTPSDLDTAFASVAQEQIELVHIGVDGLFGNNRAKLIGLAASYRVPTSYPWRDFTVEGGLMNYGADIREQFRQAGRLGWRDRSLGQLLGLALFVATIVFLRDYRVLERYRYLIASASIAILLLPRIGSPVNGAYLAVQVGPIQFQPAEFAKLGIVIFLASYLRDTRQLLVQGARRFLGVTFPPLKHFGPLLVIWGLAMLMLFVIRDLGSSVMFFGAFLALLYVATNRLSFPLIGLLLFAVGAWYLGTHIGHIHARIDAWQDPFNRHLYDQVGGSYQIAQSLFAMADGGMFGTGFGQSLLGLPGGGTILPAAHTDLIYAVITNELGLVGSCAVLLTYLLICERGFKIALLARDSFSKLLATGLTAVFALQVFVIVGGVTKVIPLTGVTLPFISYGGSSLLANFVLLALLLLVSDRARRPA